MPIVRAPLDPKLSMWHFLAFYLRFFREREGISLTQCGRVMGLARSTVSNVEAGRLRPQEDQLKKLDARYGTGVLFQMLLWYARMAHDPDWGRQLIKFEEKATLIRTYHGQVVPLVLQTDAYTWAYVQASPARDREMAMSRRLARKQALLGRREELDVWAIVDEAVLARPAGGVEVMREQIEHLLTVSDGGRTSLRVVPFESGEHMGVDGSIQILTLPDRDVAYSGAQSGGRLIESPGEARELSFIFDRIGAKAASEAVSREILRQYLERYS